MSGGIGESKPREDLTPRGHARRELLAKVRELEALGLTRDEALDHLLNVPDTDAEAPAQAPDADAQETAPASGMDPNDIADIALGRRRPDPPPAVADVLESLRRRGRW